MSVPPIIRHGLQRSARPLHGRARTGHRRFPYRSGTFDGTPVRPPNPLHIFGSSSVAAWLAPEQWTAASWPDRTGNLTLTQATASKQFTTSTINGITVPRGDGVDDYISGTSSGLSLAVGTRPYFALVVRQQPIAGFHITAVLTAPIPAYGLALYYDTAFSTDQLQAGFGEVGYSGPAFDSSVHLLEYDWGSDAATRFRVDGVAYGTPDFGTPDTAALPYEVTGLQLPLDPNVVTGPIASADFGDALLLREVPSDEDRAAFYGWITWKWGLPLP